MASSGGGGGARGGPSSTGSGSRASSSSASRSSTTRTVTSASQSRYSSGLAKYNGPTSLTNLAPGSRAVFVPTGDNYFVWFVLINGNVEEYGKETDDVPLDKDDLPPGCTLANTTSDPTRFGTNDTSTIDRGYLLETHTYTIDDVDITCAPVDITMADSDDDPVGDLAKIYLGIMLSLAGIAFVFLLAMAVCRVKKLMKKIRNTQTRIIAEPS